MIEQSVVVEFSQDERDRLGYVMEQIFDFSERRGVERLLAGQRIPLVEARSFSRNIATMQHELQGQIEALELIERRIDPELRRADRERRAYEAAMMPAGAGMAAPEQCR